MNIILGIMGILIVATIGVIGVIAWFGFKETIKEPPFNSEIQDQEREYVVKNLRANETGFQLTPSYALHHMPL